MDLQNVYFFLTMFKTNCEPEDDLTQVETCSSIKWIEISCVWTDTGLIFVLLRTQRDDSH
jgi:hypothetical protein